MINWLNINHLVPFSVINTPFSANGLDFFDIFILDN